MSIFTLVLKLSLTGSIVALPVLLLRPAVQRKLPYISMPLLWILVLIVFFIPVKFSSPVSLQNVLNLSGLSNALISRISSGPEKNEGSGLPYAGYDAKPGRADANISMYIWLTGCIILSGYFAFQRVRLYKRFKNAAPAGALVCENIFGPFGLRIRVFISESAGAPMTYGVLKPKIILPSSFLTADEITLNHVINHEIQHIRHFDSFLCMAWLCLLCVHWFNPAAWLCRLLARKDMEIFCDMSVVNKIGFSNRADYARTILNLTPVRGINGIPLSFNSSTVRMRITRIMAYRRPKVLSWCALAVLMCVLVTAFAASPAAPATLTAEAPAALTSAAAAALTPAAEEETGADEYIFFLFANETVINNNSNDEQVLKGNYKLIGSLRAAGAAANVTLSNNPENAAYTGLAFSVTSDKGDSGFTFRGMDIYNKEENAGYMLLERLSFSSNSSQPATESAISAILRCDDWLFTLR